MGTKLNPGKFDCYAKAKPDEPMFILLARDKLTPFLICAWAILSRLRGKPTQQILEAVECARNAAIWRAERNGEPIPQTGYRPVEWQDDPNPDTPPETTKTNRTQQCEHYPNKCVNLSLGRRICNCRCDRCNPRQISSADWCQCRACKMRRERKGI